jgi:hypothetical protein
MSAAIVDDDLLSIKPPPPTKTPEKSGTKLLSFSTGKLNNSKALTEKLRKKTKKFILQQKEL